MITVLEKSKIKTEVISFQLNDELSADLLSQSFDYTPYVYLKKIDDSTTNPPIIGTSIDARDIIFVKLFNNKFLPEIELCCYDSKGILFNDLYPFDHDMLICVFFKSNSENTMPIRMDFRCTSYETIKSDENRDIFKYIISGILNVDELHYTRYEAKKGTSYTVLKELALQMNLGWASNISDSDDEMCWINPQETYLKYINEITKYSWISEDSFIWTFIDFWYNLNYVDVNIELQEFNNEELGAFTNPQIEKNTEEKNVLLYLTNNKAYNMTNKYISKFNLLNQSFKVNLEKNYKMKGTWYVKNDNTVYKQNLKQLRSDETKLGSSEGKLNQLVDESSQLYEESINDEFFFGKYDTDNVHKNYSLAKYTNKFNLDTLEKMKMVITLNKLNFSIKRFQNIKIEIYNPQDLFSQDANTKSAENNLNTKLSGYWFVTGINYIFKRNGLKGGAMEQEITLMRRDLSTDYGQGSDSKVGLRK